MSIMMLLEPVLQACLVYCMQGQCHLLSTQLPSMPAPQSCSASRRHSCWTICSDNDVDTSVSLRCWNLFHHLGTKRQCHCTAVSSQHPSWIAP